MAGKHWLPVTEPKDEPRLHSTVYADGSSISLSFKMGLKETKAPPSNAPEPLPLLQVGVAEPRLTAAGSASATPTPVTLAEETVTFWVLPVGLEAFWPP